MNIVKYTYTSIEAWAERHSNELDCIFAETGADREIDFDREREEEKLWENNTPYPQLTYSYYVKEEK